MLDIKLIRTKPQAVRAALSRRSPEATVLLDKVIVLDEQRRELLPQVEDLRRQAKERSAEVAIWHKTAGALDPAERARLAKEKGKWAKEPTLQAATLTAQLNAVDEEYKTSLLLLPNIPDETTADVDTTIRTWGEPVSPVKTPLDHLALAGDMVDMHRGSRLSGSRFAYITGDLVMLEMALTQWALHKLRGHGFKPVIPPVLVREQALMGTGFLPDTEQQIYHLPADDLYLVGTSEVALASMHAGETLEADELPIRYAGISPCFRREAGAAGAADKGLFRVHQFNKIEMFSFVEPDLAVGEHERILGIEEEILQELELPYRVVNIAVDDLGPSAAKKYDCEAWLPSQGRYRELTSSSNTTDFQARRLDARYRPAPGEKPVTLATLNGTAVAVGRTLIAIMENHQNEDGSVTIPKALVAFGAPEVLQAT